MFYDSGYDDTIKPYDINIDINTIMMPWLLDTKNQPV
jgi:hypothetical protein